MLGYHYGGRESWIFALRFAFSTTPSMNNKRVVTHKSMSPRCTKARMHKSNEMYELQDI
jgi:hypothetical protein